MIAPTLFDIEQLKRQHSVELFEPISRKSPGTAGPPTLGITPPEADTTTTAETPALDITGSRTSQGLADESFVGSPLKKHRGSVYDNVNDSFFLNNSPSAPISNILNKADAGETATVSSQTVVPGTNEEEEL